MTAATPFDGLGKRRTHTRGLVSPTEGESTTARMRAALRDNGPMTGAALRELVGLSSVALVGALLKHDLHTGRVKFSGGQYQLSAKYDEQEREQVSAAIELLRRRGYEVRAA